MPFRTAWNRYFSAPIPNFLLRSALMVVGVACVGGGIALAKYSATGTSPLSAIPAVLTDFAHARGITVVTLGMLSFAINFLFFVTEVALLGRKFQPLQVLQIPVLFVMSWFVDFWMSLITRIHLPNYAAQLVCLAVSMLVTAFGVACELKANILLIPGDAVVHTIAYVTRKPFGTCKVTFDVSLMVGGAALSFALLGGLFGVREGTVIAAIAVGLLIKQWMKVLGRLEAWLPPAPIVVIPAVVPHVHVHVPALAPEAA